MAVTKRKLIYPMVALLIFMCLLVIAVFYIQLKDLDALRDMVAQEIQAVCPIGRPPLAPAPRWQM